MGGFGLEVVTEDVEFLSGLDAVRVFPVQLGEILHEVAVVGPVLLPVFLHYD